MAICLLQSGHATQHLWVSFLATIWSNRAPPIGQDRPPGRSLGVPAICSKADIVSSYIQVILNHNTFVVSLDLYMSDTSKKTFVKADKDNPGES